MRIIL
jgi:hypothetical protein